MQKNNDFHVSDSQTPKNSITPSVPRIGSGSNVTLTRKKEMVELNEWMNEWINEWMISCNGQQECKSSGYNIKTLKNSIKSNWNKQLFKFIEGISEMAAHRFKLKG